MASSISLAGLTGFAVFIFYLIISKVIDHVGATRFSMARGCKPPRKFPQPERIIGLKLLRSMRVASKSSNSLQANLKRFETAGGDTYQATVLGRTFINTKDPENIQAVLATNFKDFDLGQSRIKTFDPFLGKGIFTSDGAHWEESRALLRPNFSRAHIMRLDIFERHVQCLINKIPRDLSTVDLQNLFFQLAIDITTEFLFGESTNILASSARSEQQNFNIAFDLAQAEIARRSRFGSFPWIYETKNFNRARKTVHAFIDAYVHKALNNRKEFDDRDNKINRNGFEGYIFLNELAQRTHDPKRIRDELLNILLAGRDTTAGLLSHTFHVLARRPDIWSILKAEVDQLQGRKPDYESLRNMTYLKYLINESLRLYPVIPLNGRCANKNTTLPRGGGPDGSEPIFIGKGQIVAYSVYGMHRSAEIYGEDAEEFRPERWEGLRPGWGYLPFNGGPRICIGQQFALVEVGYTIVRLVQEFGELHNRDETDWVQDLSLTLAVKTGVKVALLPRTTSDF